MFKNFEHYACKRKLKLKIHVSSLKKVDQRKQFCMNRKKIEVHVSDGHKGNHLIKDYQRSLRCI